jgi:hypothetical protein
MKKTKTYKICLLSAGKKRSGSLPVAFNSTFGVRRSMFDVQAFLSVLCGKTCFKETS